MRMAPDKVCPGPCPVVAVAEGGGGPLAPSGVPLAVPVALISCPAAPQPPKEGDGASEAGGVEGVAGEGEKGVCEDDDLTSLSWLLQDKNILKGINLRTGAASGAQESPTSDYVDDSASEQGDSTCSSVNSSSPVPPHGAPSSGSGKNKHPHHIPYDPKVHVTSKPPYSFSCLIFMAIEDCALKALPVKEIYAWILDHFPYYKNAPTGWKNSVRHNLSLNKCFCKVEKAPNLGKGSLWMVDPVYRPNLVQALKKAPYHPYAVMGTGSERSVSGRTSQPPDSLSGEQSDDVISTPNSKSCAAEPQEPGRLLPDPDLFPYLSRRLLAAAAAAAAAADHPAVADGEDSQLDDVDAAAAMLALKHGPHVRMSLEQRKDEYHKQLTAVNLTSKGKKKSKDEEQDVLITSCPSEDHTYSVEHTQALHTDMYTYRFTNNNNNNTTTLTTTARDIVKTEPTSPDEAFQEGSDSNSSWAVRAAKANGNRSTAEVLGGGGERDVEEQRKIAEGADALLNLAGIATSLRRSRSSTAHAAAAKRQRLQVEQDVEREDGEMEEDEEDEDRLVIKEEIKMEEDEEEDREVERVPFRPRLLRKSPMKRDLMRRELERKREKKACMKVLSYAQAIMDSMEKNNNNNSSTTTNTSSSNHHLSPPSLMTSSPTKVGGAKVRRKSLLTPVKHVAKVKR